ncbi:hypothetical protein [Microbulbifer sp. JTAC008]|uniref:hypothetical protein n=1 Tax=unclassified Microbulbifer TaxID=2619833 RepID=UPI00403A7816
MSNSLAYFLGSLAGIMVDPLLIIAALVFHLSTKDKKFGELFGIMLIFGAAAGAIWGYLLSNSTYGFFAFLAFITEVAAFKIVTAMIRSGSVESTEGGRGLFGSLKPNWDLAGGVELRKEFIDMIEHLQSRNLVGSPILIETIYSLMGNLHKEYGKSVFELPEIGRKESSKLLMKQAREVFNKSFEAAVGFSFVAMALKASTLPGEDAKFVLEKSMEIISSAENIGKEVTAASEAQQV